MSERRVVAALLLLAVLATIACGRAEAPPHVDLALELEVPSDAVTLGRGFPLQVVRVWSRAFVPEDLDLGALAPLELQLLESRRIEDATHVQETLRYRAHAFTPRDVRLNGVSLRATPRGGGAERVALAAPVTVALVKALPARDDSPPELPDPPHAEPAPSPLVPGGVGLLLAALLLGGLALRRRSRDVGPAQTRAEPPEARALALLEALSPDVPDVAALADVLRQYVFAAFGVPAPRRTTEELSCAAASGHLPSGAQPAELLALLASGDRVKFAGATVTLREWTDICSRAAAYVRSTAREGGA